MSLIVFPLRRISWIETPANQSTSVTRLAGSVEQRNRVLRNTYWLLALSMVPTVLGAWLGVATGIVATHGRRA